MPQPEDSGGPPHPDQLPGCFVLASGTLKPWPSATSSFRSCTNFQGTRLPLRPTGFSVYASPVLFGYSFDASATGATLDTGGWLALARPGLTPSKIRQAYLGAATPRITGPQQRRPAPLLWVRVHALDTDTRPRVLPDLVTSIHHRKRRTVSHPLHPWSVERERAAGSAWPDAITRRIRPWVSVLARPRASRVRCAGLRPPLTRGSGPRLPDWPARGMQNG
jgi:hypothetical protein